MKTQLRGSTSTPGSLRSVEARSIRTEAEWSARRHAHWISAFRTAGRCRIERNANSLRRGISLIEMVIVMFVAMIMLSAGVGMIHLLLRTQRYSEKSVLHHRSVSRLAERWRHDVHAAADIALQDADDSDPSAELSLSNNSVVRYTLSRNAVQRDLQNGDDRTAHDQFRFEPQSSFEFEFDPETRIAALILHRPAATFQTGTAAPVNGYAPARTMRFEALLARDRREPRVPEEGEASP